MEKLRPLDPNEKWYWLADHYSSTAVSVLLSWDKKLSREEIQQALNYCQIRIEVYSCVVDESDLNNPFWVKKNIPPIIPIEWRQESHDTPIRGDELYKAAEQENSLKFKGGESLLRCLVIQNNFSTGIILTTPHYVADGTSLFYLAQEFSQGLRTKEASLFYPFNAPLETFFPSNVKGPLGILKFIKLQINSLFKEIFLKPFRIQSNIHIESRKTLFLFHELDKESAKKVFEFSKRDTDKTTVNDLLTSLFAQAISTTLDVSSKTMAIGCPVDLRSFLPKKPLYGPMVSAHMSYPILGERNLKKSMVQLRNDLVKSLNQHGTFLFLKPLGFITKKSPKESQRLLDKVLKLGPGNITISNMGRLNFTEADFFGLSGSLNISGYLMLGVCSLGKEDLRFVFAWVEGVLSHDQILDIKNNFLFQLKQLS